MGSILSMQWPVSGSKPALPRVTPDFVHVANGLALEWRGRVAVLRGRLTHNEILCARGHRQQLVGILQRLWRRDRAGVEAWVDALLGRRLAGIRLRVSALARCTPAPSLLQEQ